jgi:preprotein translocase subunit SecD
MWRKKKMIKLTLKIWIMLIVLTLSVISIFGVPPMIFEKGVIIGSVERNSTAFEQGIREGEIITHINGERISDMQEYTSKISSIFIDENLVRITITTKNLEYILYDSSPPKIIVENIPKTRIKKGLDLEGGARALVKPEIDISSSEMEDLIALSNERFNVYGLRDVSIRQVSDLSGNNFMLIEIAGATPQELEKLIGEQGKFEAKIGNETVFVGGNKDITFVCRNDPQCSRIERCEETTSGTFCSYSFEITLSELAAKRHAEITNNLGLDPENRDYLDKKLDFYIDDILTTSLFISKNLRGRETTQISIQGSGNGPDRASAYDDAQISMKQMQTILMTGSLPYKLQIEKLDTISPIIGHKFDSLILLVGVFAFLAVGLIIFLRYRAFKASLVLIFTSFSEIIIILGIASLIKWNLDLPSIVGILVTIGTGVDQQIVILDESKSKRLSSLKEKLKMALFVVISAYFTTFVSLLPLYWAGAGLLRGFAVTTIIGLTVGVLVTRPAFADMIRIFEEKSGK